MYTKNQYVYFETLKHTYYPNIAEIVTILLPADKEGSNIWIDFATGDKGGDVISLYRYINKNMKSYQESALELARDYVPYLLLIEKYEDRFDNDFGIICHYKKEQKRRRRIENIGTQYKISLFTDEHRL